MPNFVLELTVNLRVLASTHSLSRTNEETGRKSLCIISDFVALNTMLRGRLEKQTTIRSTRGKEKQLDGYCVIGEACISAEMLRQTTQSTWELATDQSLPSIGVHARRRVAPKLEKGHKHLLVSCSKRTAIRIWRNRPRCLKKGTWNWEKAMHEVGGSSHFA